MHTSYILYKCRKTVSKCQGNHRKNGRNTNDKPTNTRQTDRHIERMWHGKPKRWHTTTELNVSSFVDVFIVCEYVVIFVYTAWERQNGLLIRYFALCSFTQIEHSIQWAQRPKKEGKNWYNTKRIENKQYRIRFGVRHSISALALACVCACNVFNGS